MAKLLFYFGDSEKRSIWIQLKKLELLICNLHLILCKLNSTQTNFYFFLIFSLINSSDFNTGEYGHYIGSSVAEEHLSPLAKLVSSLIEVVSLVEATGPLNQRVTLISLIHLFGLSIHGLVVGELCVVELSLPSLKFISTIKHNK